MEYKDVIYFSETWGLLILASMFGAAIVYAFWPGNSEKFEHAANLPLEDDDQLNEEADNG